MTMDGSASMPPAQSEESAGVVPAVNGGVNAEPNASNDGNTVSVDVAPVVPSVVRSTVTPQQWQAMVDVVSTVYNTRLEDNYDPSRVFHRRVNKRSLPDYYEVIKEPMALSTLKQKINSKAYKEFSEFVRDCTLIIHNAQTYNRPEAPAYQDSLVIKEVFEREFKLLADQLIISHEASLLPDLGEIPPVSPLPLLLEGEEEEDDEDEDEEEDDESDDENKKRRKRGPRSSKRDGKEEPTKQESESRIKRGRPPRIDTPLEARIKNIYKGLRKLKTRTAGELKVRHFEKLPDKNTNVLYYSKVPNPIALDIIKRKTKRKKYSSVDEFMQDVELMFENAKMYNEENSEIYKDAVDLQMEGRKLASIEKSKPDSAFVDEDGRFPLPNGIVHNHQFWRVGDWVHIQNGNDPAKPIIAQIYRTWQDIEGNKWVNACWYYRPEQTVHHYEKHFYPNEVVKTGQYRDHPIDEVIDHCYVMFVTRYFKGRPKGFPTNKEVYVCEARYNEENKKINKIKTWSSCLPDEVRDQDYEMDLFDVPKKPKKIPSPIRHLLKPDAKETDDIPEEEWGVENAPPRIGAVHRRPREDNESPPPEPTPSPPPQLPPQPMPTMTGHGLLQPQASLVQAHSMVVEGLSVPMQSTLQSITQVQPIQAQVRTATPSAIQYNRQYQQQSASPIPAPVYPPQSCPPPHPAAPYTPQPPRPAYIPPPQTTPSVAHHYQAAQTPPAFQLPQPHRMPGRPNNIYGSTPQAYNAPRLADVYVLPDSVNSAIPADIRSQFQTDNEGRIVWFTKPPLITRAPIKSPFAPRGASGSDTIIEYKSNAADDVPVKKEVDLSRPVIKPETHGFQHSARYLAAKAKRVEQLKRKREAEASSDSATRPHKRAETSPAQTLVNVRESVEEVAIQLVSAVFQDNLDDPLTRYLATGDKALLALLPSNVVEYFQHLAESEEESTEVRFERAMEEYRKTEETRKLDNKGD